MGHPLGATGAMILGTVLDELERRDKETALVTLCIGVGMGTATIIERVGETECRRSTSAKFAVDTATGYPSPFNKAVEGRSAQAARRAAGLTQFGVNICTLKPGAASSQRHWHENEDELVYVLEGEVVLCEDDGETVLKPGDAAAWKAGVPNGHCLINRSDRDAVFIEVGTRAPTERAHYSDIDMMVVRDEKGVRLHQEKRRAVPEIGADAHGQFQTRHRRRRHRAGHLGHGRPFDERHHDGRHRGARRGCRESRGRCRHQGRGHHLGQGRLLRRRRSHHARAHGHDIRRHDPHERRGSGRGFRVRGKPQAVAALPAHRNLRQAVGLRAQRHRHGRRLRARARLPSPRRRRQPQDAARPARDQDRTVPRRRRHPARRAHDPACRRAAIFAQGRSAQGRPRQGDEADRQRRAGGRTHQGGEGLDQGRRQGRRAVGCAGFPPAGRAGLFQGGHDDIPRRQRDLPARDLRQLSGGARHSPGGLRRLAAAVRHRAARGVALVRQDFALAGSGGDDPLAVRVDAGSQQGRAAPAERAADDP